MLLNKMAYNINIYVLMYIFRLTIYILPSLFMLINKLMRMGLVLGGVVCGSARLQLDPSHSRKCCHANDRSVNMSGGATRREKKEPKVKDNKQQVITCHCGAENRFVVLCVYLTTKQCLSSLLLRKRNASSSSGTRCLTNRSKTCWGKMEMHFSREYLRTPASQGASLGKDAHLKYLPRSVQSTWHKALLSAGVPWFAGEVALVKLGYLCFWYFLS